MAADGVAYTVDPVLCEESFDTDAVTKVQACVPWSKETSVRGRQDFFLGGRCVCACACACVCVCVKPRT